MPDICKYRQFKGACSRFVSTTKGGDYVNARQLQRLIMEIVKRGIALIDEDLDVFYDFLDHKENILVYEDWVKSHYGE